MALASPFFGKREPEPASSASPAYPSGGLRGTTSTVKTDTPSTGQPISTARTNNGLTSDTVGTAPAAQEGGSRLIVGPNIKLKGVEITDCDTLVVEGTVEATMDSRVIQIAATGAFKGSADIDIAEIHGQFDGNLTVRQKLVIYAQGKVTGTIRYGKVVIEEGGQLSGDVQFGTASNLAKASLPMAAASSAAAAGKHGIQVAA
jgi:cytoskeletal protein CcmA (bactofilin family)